MAEKVPQNVLDTVYGSKPADWHQHKNGGGWVYKTAKVEESAYLHPTSIVYGNARVSGNAQVSGDAWVYGNARVYGNAQVSGNAWVSSPLYIQGTRHSLTNSKYGYIKIGCYEHTFTYWQEHYKAIGRAEGYTPEEIDQYGLFIRLFAKIGK